VDPEHHGPTESARPAGNGGRNGEMLRGCGSGRATGLVSTQSSLNDRVMYQAVSGVAGKEAKSPGLSVSAGPLAISMVTSPWGTWIVSRRSASRTRISGKGSRGPAEGAGSAGEGCASQPEA
jgi:hypothetical protein